ELGTGCTEGLTCAGNTLIECDNGTRTTVECGAPLATGPTCLTGPDGRGWCADAPCSAASLTCDGSIARECNLARGLTEATDCGALGLECATGRCTSPGGGGACTGGLSTRCDGTVLVKCYEGVESRIDCATRFPGATCIADVPPLADEYCGYAS